jgi:hypothetical protein
MPQETNLNVSPYFDDFDKNKNFYRVLFKPGSPVQARELSTLQSILQNQIEQFGTHFFKEGSKVIPGNLSYDNNFTCVQVEDAFLGIPVSLYTSQLIGLRITGARSGVTATIKKIVSKEDSDRGNLTFYIKYEKSGVVALLLHLNGKMIEWVYKENIGQCLKSKRVASREVGGERVIFSCKLVKGLLQEDKQSKYGIRLLKVLD